LELREADDVLGRNRRLLRLAKEFERTGLTFDLTVQRTKVFPVSRISRLVLRTGWNSARKAANEQDSQKLMALIKQITALLDAKQERLIEKESQGLKSERTD
jgi:hypothetical protein